MFVMRSMGRPQLGLAAVVAFSVAAGVAAWLLVVRSSTETGAPVPLTVREDTTPVRPLVLTQNELRRIAGSDGDTIYWAGDRPDAVYELTRSADGGAYVRYLPRGVAAGSRRSAYLTVATYPQADAFARVTAASRRSGSVTLALPGGGLAVYAATRPTNVYVAYPGGHEQVEIYDPTAREALRLIRAGRVAPVTGSPAVDGGASRAVSQTLLRDVAAARAAPVYWAGVRAHSVFELTETGDGRVYLRYLQRRSQVGSTSPSYLTVATYPDALAFRHVLAASRRRGSVRLSLPHGGLAVYDAAHATSVYVAYPGEAVQVEVYDPSAAEARRLVKQGLILPIR